MTRNAKCPHCFRYMPVDLDIKPGAMGYRCQCRCQCGALYTISIQVEAPVKEARHDTDTDDR